MNDNPVIPIVIIPQPQEIDWEAVQQELGEL